MISILKWKRHRDAREERKDEEADLVLAFWKKLETESRRGLGFGTGPLLLCDFPIRW
jgi:hypothetical protein